jgi:hypothetical protein
MSDHEPTRDRIARMVRLSENADAVWARIGDFGALADWHPLVATAETAQVDGRTFRHVTLTDGSLLYERLLESGPRHVTWSLEDSPLPVADHRATLSVAPEPDGGCHVHWSAIFAPADGADAQVDAFFAGFFERGLEALQD